MANPKCKNCGCVITRFKKDEYCPKCGDFLKNNQPYKMFKRRTHRMLLIGLRDAAIVFALAVAMRFLPFGFGIYLKWYIFACAGLVLFASLAGYSYENIKTNRKMYQEGYGETVEADDFFAHQLAKLKKKN